MTPENTKVSLYIVEHASGKPVKLIGKGLSERKAERIERGALINLDRDRYFISERQTGSVEEAMYDERLAENI